MNVTDLSVSNVFHQIFESRPQAALDFVADTARNNAIILLKEFDDNNEVEYYIEYNLLTHNIRFIDNEDIIAVMNNYNNIFIATNMPSIPSIVFNTDIVLFPLNDYMVEIIETHFKIIEKRLVTRS